MLCGFDMTKSIFASYSTLSCMLTAHGTSRNNTAQSECSLAPPPALPAAAAGDIAAGIGMAAYMPCAAMCGGMGPMAVGTICRAQPQHTKQ
jgi:hypothetical protein